MQTHGRAAKHDFNQRGASVGDWRRNGRRFSRRPGWTVMSDHHRCEGWRSAALKPGRLAPAKLIAPRKELLRSQTVTASHV
jgi:hypothetical protein